MPIKKIENNVYKTYETWTIENLNTTMANSSKTPVTHEFLSEFEGNVTKWHVELYHYNTEEIDYQEIDDQEIDGQEIDDQEIVIMLHPVHMIEFKKHITCNYYLVDADGNLVFITRKNQRFDESFFCDAGRDIFAEYGCLSIKRTDKLVPNDTMTLRIELITYLDDNPTFPYERAGYLIDIENLPQNFLELYESCKDNGDIVIQVQDTQFKVHRTVLETRCPVLYEDVARHQRTPESKGTELNITGIDPEIFKRLVEFLYTGEINDLDDHSEYLLEAADRYKLKRLKQLCEKSLIDNYLTADNYEELENLAVRCHATQLDINVEDFKFKLLTRSEEFVRSDNVTVITVILPNISRKSRNVQSSLQ
ncbi:uncharacterized protein LOC130672102 [Microplitis mediator]|uniref:uncharacterized protein LOC130672102 n=1 Tax=Microplitis mediator TaxID=375433 RepID=UPI0025554DB9|nr:uncharacterized protein LOC130672102 [Microplitis mediator]